MWIVESIHTDNCRWWATEWEHSNKDKERVVDPVELLVESYRV